MTRSLAGLTVLLCVLFCAVPLRAPVYAATIPFFGVGPDRLPQFDTSYYLILQPLPDASRPRASVHARPHASADLHAHASDPWRSILLALPGPGRGSNLLTLLRDRPALVALIHPARWPVPVRYAPSWGRHPLFVTWRPIWFGADPLAPGTPSPADPGPDITLGQNAPAPVPLPAGLWFLATGLGFALFFRRRSA